MTQVAATEFVRNFGLYREAAQREPVAVIAHKRVAGYFLSAHDYAEYQQLKTTQRKAYAIEEMDDATAAAIAAGRMDSRHAHLDSLLD